MVLCRLREFELGLVRAEGGIESFDNRTSIAYHRVRKCPLRGNSPASKSKSRNLNHLRTIRSVRLSSTHPLALYYFSFSHGRIAGDARAFRPSFCSPHFDDNGWVHEFLIAIETKEDQPRRPSYWHGLHYSRFSSFSYSSSSLVSSSSPVCPGKVSRCRYACRLSTLYTSLSMLWLSPWRNTFGAIFIAPTFIEREADSDWRRWV